ncbi:hypothetical protein Tco_1064629, partial [Tanacetum coccineum]
ILSSCYGIHCCCWGAQVKVIAAVFVAVSILKLTLPTGRVIVATSGYVVPAAYDISPGLKDLSRAKTNKFDEEDKLETFEPVDLTWRESLLKNTYCYCFYIVTMTSPYPTPPFTGPSPSDSSFSIPTTSEPVFSMATTEPVFQAQTSSSAQPSQNPQPQFQQYNSTTNIVLQGNNRKRTGRDPIGNIMMLPPVTMEEQIAVQREIKARTILLQFGGNEESKKMRKSMLKQEFADFKISESEGLHKGYDRFQKVLSQLNQMQARPDNEDCNMKFLRALPTSCHSSNAPLKTKVGLDFLSFDDLYNKLRTLEIDVKGNSSYDSRVPAAPTHSAFISAASTNSKWSNADSKGKKGGFERQDLEKGASEAMDDCRVLDDDTIILLWILPEVYAADVGADSVSVAASDATNAETEFALMGLSPQVQSCPFGCNHIFTELKKEFDDLEVQYKECFLQVQAYKSSLQNLEQQKSWYQNNQLALEEKIRILTADLGNTTNMLNYTEKLNEQAKLDNMNTKVKLEESNARFDKWKESSKNLVKLINSSMSSRSKFGLGYVDTFGSDEVFDLSAPSIFDSCLKDAIEKPLYDRFVKAGGLHAVPGPITGTFMPPSNKPDIDDTQFTYGSKSNNYSESNSVSNDFVSCDNSDKSSDSETTGFASCTSSVNSSSTMTNAPSSVDFKTLSKTADQRPISINDDPSFSFKENVKPPRNLCNKSGINSRSLCKRKSFGFKTCFVCGSKFHLIKDCDFYEKQLGLNNKPLWNNVTNIPSFVPTAASVPTGSRNRSTSIPADRPFPAGWKNHAARPMTRPSSHYFQHFSRPGSYNQMNMDRGRWGTAVKPSAGCSWRIKRPNANPHKNKDLEIVDSGCSRSMTGNKEKLDDFKYLKGQPKLGLWYPRDSPFVLEAYSDSDYAGSHGDRKSTTGRCQFLGRRLISWQCKKQTIVATTSTKAEYVAAANCCGQIQLFGGPHWDAQSLSTRIEGRI